MTLLRIPLFHVLIVLKSGDRVSREIAAWSADHAASLTREFFTPPHSKPSDAIERLAVREVGSEEWLPLKSEAGRGAR